MNAVVKKAFPVGYKSQPKIDDLKKARLRKKLEYYKKQGGILASQYKKERSEAIGLALAATNPVTSVLVLLSGCGGNSISQAKDATINNDKTDAGIPKVDSLSSDLFKIDQKTSDGGITATGSYYTGVYPSATSLPGALYSQSYAKAKL